MEKSKVSKIRVSFKHTKRDAKLFNISDNQEEKSEFIKDAIEYYLMNCYTEIERIENIEASKK